MKQQQIQKQKQTTAQKIKQKTKHLIKNIIIFKTVENNFKKSSIKLCSELIDLHKIKDPEYSFCQLLQEKELQDYSDVLETYVPYDVSPLVTDMYIKGRLSNTDLMVLANTDKEFQQPELQQKIVEGIIKKEINSRELIRATPNEIKKMIGEEVKELEEYDKMIIECLYHTTDAIKSINKYKKELLEAFRKKPELKKRFIDNFSKLKNTIQFGLKIKLK